MAIRRDLGGLLLQRFFVLQAEPVGEPPHHVAALAQGPAKNESAPIETVDKGPPGDSDAITLEQDPHRARRSDRGAHPAWADGARPDIGESPVADGKIPRNLAEGRPSP